MPGGPLQQFLGIGGSPLITPCLPHLSLTSSWLFPVCAVIITAFDLTDIQTLEHTRQVWDSVALEVQEAAQKGFLKLGP